MRSISQECSKSFPLACSSTCTFVMNHYVVVILTVLLVLILKFTVAGFTAFLPGHTFRGVIMVVVALGQVGEFSFILANDGADYGILSPYYYQLFLAVAVVTMSLSPFTLQVAHPGSEWLLKWAIPRFWVDCLFPASADGNSTFQKSYGRHRKRFVGAEFIEDSQSYETTLRGHCFRSGLLPVSDN